MADAHAGWHDAEAVKCLLRPTQERVTLRVALVLPIDVPRVGLRQTEPVDLHRVVDHEVDGHEWIDPSRILARAPHRVAHRREIDHGRHTREVLHEHARRHEGDLDVTGWPLRPARQSGEGVRRRLSLRHEAREPLEEDLHRHGQPFRPGAERGESPVGQAGPVERTQTVSARAPRQVWLPRTLAMPLMSARRPGVLGRSWLGLVGRGPKRSAISRSFRSIASN